MIRRTATITAATIAGVVLAGGIAVGTNIGILTAADDTALGQLSADAPILLESAAPGSAVHAAASDPGSAPAPATAQPAAATRFLVDDAGEIAVTTAGEGLAVADVATNPGWTWDVASAQGEDLVVRFRSGDDLLQFTARPQADGTIRGDVVRPTPDAGSVSGGEATDGQGAPQVFDDDDGYEGDQDDDHDEGYEDDDEGDEGYEDNDDDHEESEHLGGDDDD